MRTTYLYVLDHCSMAANFMGYVQRDNQIFKGVYPVEKPDEPYSEYSGSGEDDLVDGESIYVDQLDQLVADDVCLILPTTISLNEFFEVLKAITLSLGDKLTRVIIYGKDIQNPANRLDLLEALKRNNFVTEGEYERSIQENGGCIIGVFTMIAQVEVGLDYESMREPGKTNLPEGQKSAA